MATRKETSSIGDLVADVAYRKRRAAAARFVGTLPGKESPRDVYLAACASIGAHLNESYGFKYSKSGPHARLRLDDFTFEVSFQSDSNNVAEERVGLWIHANVWSPKLKKWRASQPLLQPFDYVAGGQLGNLKADQSWLDWNLADSDTRDETIRDAIQAIEELAFPYFARFEDLPSLCELLVDADFPAMTIDRVVEFLMCYAEPSTARAAAASFLTRRPDLLAGYRREFERYAKGNLGSQRPSGYAQQLAFASHAFQFGDLSAEPPAG